MLRKKQLRLVVTFHTTMAAMQTEQQAKKQGIEGRLIPVPQEISAGCGLAWSAPVQVEQALQVLFEQEKIAYQQMYHIVI